MNLKLKKIVFISSMVLMLLGISACNSSSDSADEIPQVAASQDDMERFSDLVG